MTADKRSIATDALEVLGTIIENIEVGRDAIHLAVEPVTATEKLVPGQHVGADGSSKEPHVGIVDPFLERPVQPGQRYLLVIYPRQITSLRHVWSHPAFAGDGQPVLSEADKKAASEQWLRDFIAGADCPDYHTVIAAAINGGDDAWDDDYLHFEGHDAHGEIPDVFWDHVEIVTGQKPARRAKYFSCNC